MKKLILMSALVLGGLGIKTADAQFGVHINLHLGNPVYVPARPVAVVAPVYDDYYYLPEVEAYYSVGENRYYYENGGSWISAAYLPGRRDFDWRYATRYEIHGNRPYMHHNDYRSRYGGYGNSKVYADRGGYNHDQSRGHDQYDNRGGQSHNGYNQPAPGRNSGGYQQPSQQPSHSWGGGSQPSRGGANSQPSNHSGGHDRGSIGGGSYSAQNNSHGAQGRSSASRPGRF